VIQMKLFNMGSFFHSLDPLKIDTSRCLQTISPLTSCNSCIDVCPTHSLHFAEDGLTYTECIYCGACVKVCPQEVFSMDLAKLLEDDKKKLILTCHKILPDSKDVTHINCLDQFTAETLLELALHKEVVLYADDTCKNCTNFFRLQNLELLLHRFPVLHTCKFISDKNVLEEIIQRNQSPSLSRRGFFEQALQKGQHQTAQTINQSIDKSEKALSNALDYLTDTHHIYQPQKIISARYRLLSLFMAQSDHNSELPYRALHIQSCDFCSACTHLCPTEALKLHKDETAQQIQFSPYLCNNCNLCIDVCPSHSIYWSENLSMKDLISNHTIAKADGQTCTKCGDMFYHFPDNESTLCRFCK